MAESSPRLPLTRQGHLVLKSISQPRFLLAFLNFGTAILLETTAISASNIAQQFSILGNERDVAHAMSVYFLLCATLAILPIISDRVPDLMLRWWGAAFTLSPVFVYSLFGIATALNAGTLLPIWWVGWVFILLTVIFARGLK